MEKRGVKFNHLFIRYFVLLGVLIALWVAFLFWFYGFSKYQGYASRDQASINKVLNVEPAFLNQNPFDPTVLPEKTKYILYDESGMPTTTNMEDKDYLYYIELPIDYFKNRGLEEFRSVSYSGNNDQSIHIYTLDQGYLLLEVYAPYMMTVPFLAYKDLPAIPIFAASGFAVIVILILILSKIFNRKLKKEVSPIIKTVKKIEKQNLDFILPISSIQEFNSVLTSIDIMRNSLKNSLTEQWKKEEEQKFQTASLAHDIKTPLTVIKGNTELLLEAENSNMDQLILKDIQENSRKVENYLGLLVGGGSPPKETEQSMEEIHTSVFVGELMEGMHSLLRSRDIKIKIINNNVEDFYGNRELLIRALSNILTNAVEFTPQGGEVSFILEKEDLYTEFIVEDQGEGFTKESLEKGKLKFYTHDKERSGKHYGMGLFIAEEIAKKHHGELILENQEHGGRVVLRIENK